MEDDFVAVANHEENIKTKNIVEKIKFEGNRIRIRLVSFQIICILEFFSYFFQRYFFGHDIGHQISKYVLRRS